MKKILIISTSFPRWKNDRVTSFVYYFAKSIKEKCDVHVLAPHAAGAKKYEEMEGIKVYRFRYAPERLEKFATGISMMDLIRNNPSVILLLPFFVGFATWQILKLYLAHRYDVIHVNWLVPFGPVLGFLRLFFNFNYVITAHGSDVFPFANRANIFFSFVWWLHRIFTLPHIDKIITVSTALKSEVVKMLPFIPQDKFSVISMGIDYNVFSNERQQDNLHQPLKIAFVGRLTEIKGVRYLIDATTILKKHGVDFILQIYGDGLLRNSLEAQVDQLALSNCIVFHGFAGHDLLASKLADADIFVGPSITTSAGEAEGFGLVFLEAMAAGLVAVGSRVGGISEIIKDKETGLLVEEKNPAAIADAILLLLKDEDLRKRIIKNGSKLARQYDWAIIAEKYFQIYENAE